MDLENELRITIKESIVNISSTQNWTTTQLVNFSNNLASAYCPGVNQTQPKQLDNQWTEEKLLKMSQALAQAYCVGL